MVVVKGNKLRIPVHPTTEGIDYIKTLAYYHYNPETRFWHIPYSETIARRIIAILEEYYPTVNIVDLRQSKPKKKDAYEIVKRPLPIEYSNKLIELRYSKHTYHSYRALFSNFLGYYYQYRPEEISNDQITAYLRFLVQERQVSLSYQNSAINAIKFYYEKVLGGASKTYHIKRPKKEIRLPVVLSKEEITTLLSFPQNLKHKTIIALLYSCGLRVSEAINLTLEHLDLRELQIRIIAAKGKKDRNIPLAKRTCKLLEIYLKRYYPEEYVFEGQKGGKYSATSIQKFVKRYAKACEINKQVTPHTLRHTYATHLLESGTNLRIIQRLLGHNSSKTTEIYTHVSSNLLSNIINPIDMLNFEKK